MTIFSFLYRSFKAVFEYIYRVFSSVVTIIKLNGNQVNYGLGLVSRGIPQIEVNSKGKMSIGINFRMNNGNRYNKIGRQRPCLFVVSPNAVLSIGNNTGMSGTTIVCRQKVTIGDHVKIGGNTVIYDTDFHSLDPSLRRDRFTDAGNTSNAEVIIGNDVFIGAHSTILKGVTIGEGAVIGAASLVAKSIPAYEIWAGNPARFLKKVNNVQVENKTLVYNK
ncbi:acyltransferase [Mucilaginibacter gotjawali]|uniref:Acyl-[acyl carrier protein]--UDP-N-acetylglucosamine O-acyltransferase n=1 Tax=Mucilaginibacter gotjawali TaxID=1550579 RepID=A0A839S8R4_9SPHI|nr:acyltransferase [Mucilaginibacter gotjawali]MBB3054365.1 acyl-[acyl carrier protein]--UDP-N-acetylglucosamine O-acyltransferase [Mucilaginibacter gotjawali]